MSKKLSIDEEARRIANLRVLQRMDNGILDIVGSATHVVLYEFNETSQAWEKQNVEGSLFVVKRSDSPRFKLIVMNRNSKENLELSLSSKFQMQVRVPYLMFRQDKGGDSSAEEKAIRGIWFHDGEERERISKVLEMILKSLTHATELEEKQASPPPKQPNVSDATAALMSCLQIGEDGGKTKSAPDTNVSNEPVGSQAQPSAMGTAGNQTTTKTSENIILDKKNLQLSLMSLLEDERFLDLIHAQYLKVVHARSKRDK